MHGALPVKAVESLTVLATASDDSHAPLGRALGGGLGGRAKGTEPLGCWRFSSARSRAEPPWVFVEVSLQVQEWKPLKEPAWDASADARSVRQTVSTNAYKGVLDRFHRMRATNPGDQALLGLFLENAHSAHSSHASLVKVVHAGVFLRHATHSVLQGAIGIPPLFLCPWDTNKG